MVGARGEDSNTTGVNGNQADNLASNSGAVYVFTRSGGVWSQQAYLKASNTEVDDDFGFSVSAFGDTLVVGAQGEDSNAIGVNGNQADNSAVDSGAAYIFTRSGTTWSQQAYLKASNTGTNDRLGGKMSLSGDTLVIGVCAEDSNATGVNGNQSNNSAGDSGAVYVFTRSGTTWIQQAYLKASNTETQDCFGGAVSLSGDILVVGASGEDSNATGINGDQSNNSADYSGAAYVFTRSGTTWSQQAYLKSSNNESQDSFGYTVSVSGNTSVVGASGEDSSGTDVNGDQLNNSASSSGAAYVFGLGNNTPPLYSISGRVVDGSSNGIAGVSVSDGAGHTVMTDSSGSYTLSGLASGSYTITPSKSGYTFVPPNRVYTNLQSNQSNQNYTAVPPKPPLIIVHGWQGTNFAEGGYHCSNDGNGANDIERFQRYDDTHSNSTLKAEDGKLALADWLSSNYDVWIAHLESTPLGTSSLQTNAECLRDQIKYVAQQNPDNPITIIAHSMGGLVSRAAIRSLSSNVNIKKLFTLGSPHAGIPFEAISSVIPVSADRYCLFQPAVCEMTPSLMNGNILLNKPFNQKYPNRSDISYYFIGGDGGSGLLNWYLRLTGQGPNDGLVGQYSSVGWIFSNQVFAPPAWPINSMPGQYFTSETHPSLSDKSIAYYVAPLGQTSESYKCISGLMQNPANSQYCQSAGSQSIQLNSVEANALSSNAPSFTETKTGHLNVGQAITLPFVIDSTGSTWFYLNWSGGNAPSFTLTRPDAQVIDPAYAAAHPNEVTYETADGSPEAAPNATYNFVSGQVGNWQATITAADAIDYKIFGLIDSTLLLTAQTNDDVYEIGDSATITANLADGVTGLTGATVTAKLTRPDDVVDNISLTDQGNGTYSNTYTIPNAPGYLTIDITASGSDNGTAFTRQKSLIASIAPNDLQLTGTYNDQPRDDNADGIYDFLDFSAEVNLASPGEYSVSAELYAGDQLITQSGDFFQLVAGTQTVTLPFDGHAIYTAGLDGPYTVKNLYFTPIDIGITAATVENARTTAAYSYTQFDFVPPLVSNITRANPNHTSAASVDFTVTFSEPVKNIDVVDFTLTTSGVSGATISGVSGSGSIRTVTVNTGIGSGTIRLDMPASAAINDLPGNLLTNLPFISGDTYTVIKPLAAAVLTAPIGNINKEYNPVYTWNKVVDVTHYHLYVSGPSGVVLDQWYESASICDATTCSVTPGPTATLGGGNYSWYVQTYNPVGYGPWSNNTQPTNFSTTAPTAPAAAANLSPNSAIGTNYNPNYTWDKMPAATYYHLSVNGPSGVVIDQWYPSASICPAATCSVPSPTPLAGGNYVWYVQTYNSAGYGPWTAATNFSTTVPSIPAAATNLSPNTAIGTNYNPNYTWDKVATATYYHLVVNGPGGAVLDQWYQAAAICPAATCSVASPTLGSGNYSWYVQTYNSAGYGPWSNNTQPTNFSTTAPTAPAAAANLSPNAAIGTNYNPNYTWDKVAAATYYHLVVNSPSGVVIDQWYPSASICPAATCTVPSPTPLGGGAYGWYVQTYNSAGYGPWSNNTQPTNFSTTIPSMPAAAANLSPNTAIGTDYNPNYTWDKVSMATYYHLVVNGPGGAVLDQWYQAAAICPAATCSVPSPTLGGGNYSWYVQTYNSAGYGPWSNNTQPTNFSTTIPTLPAIATNLSPSGTIASHTPTYQWNKVSMATWYHLYVKGPSGLVKDQWYQAVSICNATTCSVPSPTLESGDHIWWVQSYNTVGYSPWKSAAFTVSP